MMKKAGYILAAMGTLCWGVDEATTYADGAARVGDDGWVLLCHSVDWDSSHDEQWIRRQTAISSACGNAIVLYIPIYQNPTAEQTAELEQRLRGCPFDLSTLHSVPCAILLDKEGRPYASISGDDFTERATGLIRQAQAQLRSRNNLLREAANAEGSQRAQALSSIWRLSIAPPPGLKEKMQEADPNDSAGIAEWSPFDPQAFADRVQSLPWEAALAELERAMHAPLSQEERQAVLAIHMGCVRHHLRAAGVPELRRLAKACTALAPNTPLGKAASHAVRLWNNSLNLNQGWSPEQLPLIPAECEVADSQLLSRSGEYHIIFNPTAGQDALRVTRVTLYDKDKKISEDAHTCTLTAGKPSEQNEYMLIVRHAPTVPRLVIAFDQQGKVDSHGTFFVRYFSPDGIEEVKIDPTKAAADKARQRISGLNTQSHAKEEGEEEGDKNTTTPATAPTGTTTSSEATPQEQK